MNPYVGHESQLYGMEEHRLVGGKGDGMRLLEVNNGRGLEAVISLDRNADIARLRYRGMNLAFFSPCGDVAPAYYESTGTDFLKSFTAGFLTTCGLGAVGSPCRDEGEELPLHGTIANTPTDWHCCEEEGGRLVVPEGTYLTKLYKALRRVNTQLGTPYLGEVRYVKSPCILLGPDLDGKFLYGRLNRSGRQLRLTAAPSDTLITSVRTMPLRTAEDYPLGAPVVDHTVLLEGLAQMLRRYFDEGELRLELPKPEGN